MSKYKAICFDVDGTLYPASYMNRKVAQWVLLHPCKGRMYKATRKAFRHNQDKFGELGLGDKDFRYREAVMFAKLTNGRVSAESARLKLDSGFYKFLERYSGLLPYESEVVETFRAIKAGGLKIGIFSDWPLYDKLNRIGVDGLVDFKVSSVDMGYLKPSKRCLDYLLEKMNLKPSDILYVGDSYSKDIEGSAVSGVDAVLIGKKNDPKYEKALKVFQNWSEFDCWLRKVVEG